jgi:phytoene/squalene synthetase
LDFYLYDDEDDAQEAMEARAERKERAMAAVDELTPQPPGEQELTVKPPPAAQPGLPYEETGA